MTQAPGSALAEPYRDTRPKPFVFVLMPFDPKFNDVYKFGIKGAAEAAGAYAERVDEQLFSEGILERIFNQISKADIVVADMSDRNPNVFYEVGYAHALNKTVILLTHDSDDIPFDLKHQPHIIYGGSIDALRNDLTRRLSWAIEHRHDQSSTNMGFKLTVFHHEIEIEPRIGAELKPGPILYTIDRMEVCYQSIFQLVNLDTRQLPSSSYMYLMAEDTDISIVRAESKRIVDDITFECLHPSIQVRNFKYRFRLLFSVLAVPPGASTNINLDTMVRLNSIGDRPSIKADKQLMLRLYVRDEFIDFPFRVKVTIVR